MRLRQTLLSLQTIIHDTKTTPFQQFVFKHYEISKLFVIIALSNIKKKICLT